MFHRTTTGLAAAVLSLGLVAASAPAATALPDWRTTATAKANDRARAPKVIDLRYATHPRFDRVVVDVRGLRPGYSIRYTRHLRQDGSGVEVALHGRRAMTLRLNPAYAHNQKGSSVYTGPRKRNLDFPTLRGVAFLGDYEGYVTLGFGLDHRAPYRIFTLSHPRRIVIDFKH